MRVKTIVNGKGEPQATEIAIPIEGTGQDVVTHYHIICGFATCCELCGFMTEKSTNDLMHMVEHLVENELARVAAHDSP